MGQDISVTADVNIAADFITYGFGNALTAPTSPEPGVMSALHPTLPKPKKYLGLGSNISPSGSKSDIDIIPRGIATHARGSVNIKDGDSTRAVTVKTFSLPPEAKPTTSTSTSTSVKVMTASEVNDAFTRATMKPLQILSNIKTDPKTFTLPPTLNQMSKVCFICCNSYEGSRYALGESAMNDGLLTYLNFSKLGYNVYIFHDMSKADYMKVFKTVLAADVIRVAVYYIGHGTSTKDTSGDEDDGFDECLFFTDGVIIDDILCDTIMKCKNPTSKLILLSDCCHSGTIYDVPDRDDLISISAAADNETAKQDWIEKKGQGIFTYYFWKYYNRDITLNELRDRMNRHLKRYKQGFVTNRVKGADTFILG